MPDIETKRIDELPVATSVGDSDLFVLEQGGVAKSIEGSVIRSNFRQEVDDTLSSTSTNPVQNAVIKAALDAKANASDLDGKEDKMTEVEVIGDGAVTQALDAGKYYRFVGSLTSLTISLTSAPTGTLAHYHFDFETDATAPTLTLPSAVVMPDGFAVEANKRYEIDILNNYGAVMAWAIS